MTLTLVLVISLVLGFIFGYLVRRAYHLTDEKCQGKETSSPNSQPYLVFFHIPFQGSQLLGFNFILLIWACVRMKGPISNSIRIFVDPLLFWTCSPDVVTTIHFPTTSEQFLSKYHHVELHHVFLWCQSRIYSRSIQKFPITSKAAELVIINAAEGPKRIVLLNLFTSSVRSFHWLRLRPPQSRVYMCIYKYSM